MKKSLLLFLFLNSLLFTFTACSKKQIKTATGMKTETSVTSKKVIGISIDTLAIERWQRDLDVFINKVKEMGADVIVQNAGNSLEEQNRQLMYLLDRNIDTIVVLPKQNDGLTESIQKIKNKNIPVISYDRLITNCDIDLYITINSEKVGEEMAREMMHCTQKQNWYCILGAAEDYNMTLILQGVKKVISGSPIHIGYTFYTSGWNYDLAHQEVIRLIKYEDIPDAFICGNDAVADSVIQALNLYYNGPHIPICGQDADVAACQNIVQGKQDFTLYKPITNLAELTAEIAVKMAKGESIDDYKTDNTTINNNFSDIPVIWLEPEIVTKKNIDEVVINSGFHTYGEVYRQ